MIGIIGGVGPFAGISLHEAVLKNTVAYKDQDHLPVIHINAASEIPDRTEYLLGKVKENPAVALLRQAEKIINCGATIIGIPCNTAHSSLIISEIDEYCNSRNVTLVNMISETLDNINNERTGLLATQGTYTANIYQYYNQKYNKQIILPPQELQREVHLMIYHPEEGLKAKGGFTDYAKTQLEKVLEYYKSQDVKNIILGCTELAVFVPVIKYDSFNFVNTIDILAKKMINLYEASHT